MADIKKKKKAPQAKAQGINPKKLGPRLVKLRQGKGLDVLQAAVAAGVGYRSLSRWENQGAVPHAAQLEKLAQFYGVTSEDLKKS